MPFVSFQYLHQSYFSNSTDIEEAHTYTRKQVHTQTHCTQIAVHANAEDAENTEVEGGVFSGADNSREGSGELDTEEEREALEDEVADLRAKAAGLDFDTDELDDLAAEVGQDEDGRLNEINVAELQPREFHRMEVSNILS